VQRAFAAKAFLWTFVVAWGRSDKAGDQEFVAGQRKAMREFDGQSAAVTRPGSASARAAAATSAIASTSATASGSAMAAAPPKLAKVAQVSESAAATAETVTAPPRLQKVRSTVGDEPSGSRPKRVQAVQPREAPAKPTTKPAREARGRKVRMDVPRRGEDPEEDNTREETDADADVAMGATTDADDHVVRGKGAEPSGSRPKRVQAVQPREAPAKPTTKPPREGRKMRMDVPRRGEDSEDNGREETDADADVAMGATTDADDHEVRGKGAHAAKPTVPARDRIRKVRMAKRKGPPDSDNDADADTVGAITDANANAVETKKSRAIPQRGSQRQTPCSRCARLRRDCYEQLNSKHACWGCGTLKVRCETDGAVPAKKGKGPARKFTRAEKGKSKGEFLEYHVR